MSMCLDIGRTCSDRHAHVARHHGQLHQESELSISYKEDMLSLLSDVQVQSSIPVNCITNVQQYKVPYTAISDRESLHHFHHRRCIGYHLPECTDFVLEQCFEELTLEVWTLELLHERKQRWQIFLFCKVETDHRVEYSHPHSSIRFHCLVPLLKLSIAPYHGAPDQRLK